MANISSPSKSLDIALKEIEERVKVEKKLQETQNYLKIILNAVVDAIIVINEQGQILSFNQNVEKMFGYSFEEVQYKNVSLLMPQMHSEKHDHYIQNYLQSHNAKMTGKDRELKARRKDGTEFHIELRIHQETLYGKRIFIGLVRDISMHKSVQSELDRNKERFELAIKGSHDGFWDWDILTDEVFFSPRFKEMLGYEDDEMAHEFQEWRARLHPDDINDTIDAFQAHLTLGLPYEQIYRMKTKSGEYRWFRARGQAIWNEAGRATRMAGGLSDITDLIEAKREAEETTRLKSEFLANISHEIRTPLNGIIGMTSLLTDTPLNAKQKHFSNMVLRSADSLLMLVNDILDFSKIEAGKLSVESITVDLPSFVEDIIEFMSPKAYEKNIELLLGYSLGKVRHVMSDPIRLRQILYNLIGNALKFTKVGGVSLKIEGREIDKDKYDILFSVEDTGIGIPEDKQHLIFNKFDQADNSTTRKFGGTGLGLAICKHLVHLMGGEIGVHSKPGQGSTFWFRLVLDALPEEDHQLPFKEPLDPSCKRVLLIDDNIKVLETLKDYFAQEKHVQMDAAASADEALQKLFEAVKSHKPYDIAIIDHILPGRSGEDLGRIIRAYDELDQTLLVFCTSNPHKEDIARLKQYKFDGYLTKPLLPSKLIPFLNMLWRARHQIQPRHLVTSDDIIGKNASHQSKVKQNVLFKDVNLLLAEDNYVNRQIASELFKKYGFTVTEVENGQEAVEVYKQKRFDIVFMDWHMPEMDGVEATKIIRTYEVENNVTSTPIIAFTASLLKGDIETCMQAGMDDYTPKPLDFEDLEKKLLLWTPLNSAIFVENREPVQGDKGFEDINSISDEISAEDGGSQDILSASLIDHSAIKTMRSILGDNFNSALVHYLEYARKYMSTIEQALQTNDLASIGIAAHPLKSSSAQIGAKELSELAKTMEKLASEQHDETVLSKFLSSLYQDMTKVFSDTEAYFSDYMNDKSAA